MKFLHIQNRILTKPYLFSNLMNLEQFNSIKNTLVFFALTLIFVIVSQLSAILIPFVLALLAATMFQPLIMILKRYRVPTAVIVPIVGIITLFFVFGIYSIVSDMYSDLLMSREYLLQRLIFRVNAVIRNINDITGSQIAQATSVRELMNVIGEDFISDAAGSAANVLGSITGSFLMFSVYYILLLAGMPHYKQYLNFVAGEQGDSDLLTTYETVQRAIFSYIIIKTLVSLFTGLFVYVICILFDINFALFWGFIAFALNYIPSIGSITGSIPPILMAFIQYDSIETMIIVALLVGMVQFIMGNLIEPKILGDTLRINTVTVIFGLVFWGFIWGIPGMLVTVPLLVLMKLIFEQFPSLRIVARIMGAPGKHYV